MISKNKYKRRIQALENECQLVKYSELAKDNELDKKDKELKVEKESRDVFRELYYDTLEQNKRLKNRLRHIVYLLAEINQVSQIDNAEDYIEGK